MKNGIKVTIFLFIILLVATISTIFYITQFESPTLELIGNETTIIRNNDTYRELGAISTFLNQDVSEYISIENNIKEHTIGEYLVTYKIKLDYIKETKEITRKVIIVDENSPIIEIPDVQIEIDQGITYTDPGFKATDEYDGDLTDQVIVTHNIDTTTPGEYKVIYKVTDSSGNTFETSRKVIVRQTTTTTKKIATTKDPNKDGDTGKVTTKKGTGEGVPILMYHYFYDESAGETGKDSNWMEVKDFEAQLKHLSDNNFYYPTWQELYDFVNGKITLPSKSVIITMDDGHASIYKYAIPLLEKYKVKATAFIITSKSGASKIKKYKDHEYIEFQSHTHNMHQGGCSGGHGGLFRCINYDKGLADLQSSIDYLGTNDAIAYPYGDVTKNVLKITEAANFKIGVTTKWGYAKKGADPLQLPRIRMYKSMALSTFKSNVK